MVPGLGRYAEKDRLPTPVFLGFPGGSAGKEPTCNVGDLGLIFGLGRSPGGGNSYPLQYSGLENSIDCIVHGIAESDTTERISLEGSYSLAYLGKLGFLLETRIGIGIFVSSLTVATQDTFQKSLRSAPFSLPPFRLQRSWVHVLPLSILGFPPHSG